MNESDGFAKILIDDNNNIIGAHILGAKLIRLFMKWSL